MRARGFSPCFSPNSFEPISTPAAPSTMPDELPAWWMWLIRSRCGYFIIATLSKPGMVSPIVLEGGLQRAERLHVGAGAHVFVVVEDRQAVQVAHRDDRLGEAPVVPGRGGALLALDGEGVGVVAAEAVFGGDDVGRDALRHEVARPSRPTDRRRSPRRPSPWRRGPSSRRRRRYRPRPRRRAPGWRRGSPPPCRRRRSG